MKEIEGLRIYKQYCELIYYIELITEKYPKSEKHSLVVIIKNKTYRGMELIIKAQKEYNVKKRLEYLKELDVVLKMLKVLSRVSNKKKYISGKNYTAWSKKLYNISNMLGSWIKSCLNQ